MMLVFFFFKQKTAYEMRISDWSSDVCSSDLASVRLSLWGAIAGNTTNSFGRTPMKQSRILLAAVITAAFAAPVAHSQSQTDAAQADQAAKQAQESAEAADAAATAAEAQSSSDEDQSQDSERQASTAHTSRRDSRGTRVYRP